MTAGAQVKWLHDHMSVKHNVNLTFALQNSFDRYPNDVWRSCQSIHFHRLWAWGRLQEKGFWSWEKKWQQGVEWEWWQEREVWSQCVPPSIRRPEDHRSLADSQLEQTQSRRQGLHYQFPTKSRQEDVSKLRLWNLKTRKTRPKRWPRKCFLNFQRLDRALSDVSEKIESQTPTS